MPVMRAEDALERRIVTVLFADLVGFTTLSEQFDAEDVAAIQDRYFAAVRDTIGRYGGRLEKFIGDAAMAVFGVPRSRDDDAERAVRAGLALISAVQQLGSQLGLEDDVLRLRVGINSGEAVVAASGLDDGRVTGDTVNTAARLQTAAPPGGVLVGDTTSLAVADVAELGEQISLELKGKAEPTLARLVTGFRSEPSREQAMGALKAPTVGRDQELSDLRAGIERARAGGVERWLIVAPPGVGKSRLLRELAAVAGADANVVVWRSRARPGAVSPFDPIAGLLLSALGTSVREDAQDRLVVALSAADVVAARAQVVAEACLNLVAPRDADPAGRPPNEDRDALFGAWIDGLDALAGPSTQMWLVEDTHWAGGDVLAFLELATSRSAMNGRIVVATARPSLLEARGDWADDSAPNSRRVMRLTTLDPGDARGLVTALVGDALPEQLVESIVARSDGNCLFIEELLRTWVSVGTLVASDMTDASANAGSAWRLAVPASEIPLPHSVQQIYAAQLDDLPPDARRVARRASVAGRRFPVRALEPLEASNEGIEPLRRRELVSGPLSEPLLGDAFAYRHALLRDAGYASLARAERARLHTRLARWLEQAAGERSAEVAEQIAGHYAAAFESAPALAATIDDGLDRAEARRLAADWYERAGQAAFALSAHDAARQLLRRAIDLTPESMTLDLARRWERFADATAYAADMTEGATAYEKAIELYRSSLETERNASTIASLARATATLGNVWYQQLRFGESRDLADRMLTELTDADGGSRSRLLVARGMGALGAGGASPAIARDLDDAVDLADASGDAELQLRATHARAMLRSETGSGRAQDWHDIAAAARQLGQRRMAVGAAVNAAMGELDDAPRNVVGPLEIAREIATAYGLTEDTGWITYLEAEEAFVSGDWDRALELGRSAIDLGIANNYLRLTVRTVHVVVPIASVRADLDTLARCQDWYASLEGKFEFPDSPYSRIIRAAQDLELADAGLRPSYTPDPATRVESFVEDPSGPSWTSALDRVVRSWVDAGELDGAENALDTMGAAVDRAVAPSSLGVGTYNLMRGRVAAARGEKGAAIGWANDALARFRASDAPWWNAKAIRLLERLGAADQQLVGDVEEIERLLGASEPTR
jgi:class 3 adenylate cyclase/tetratricopeptide (TPR) repeat protein